MPTLETDGWELESATERHSQHPDTFLIPDEGERSSLGIGQMVQLLFLLVGEDGQVNCEKMWVTINERDADGYQGMLESCPASSNVLQPGATIHFTPNDVCSIFVPKP